MVRRLPFFEDWLGGKTASTVKPNVGAQSAKRLLEVVVFSAARRALLSPWLLQVVWRAWQFAGTRTP